MGRVLVKSWLLDTYSEASGRWPGALDVKPCIEPINDT